MLTQQGKRVSHVQAQEDASSTSFIDHHPLAASSFSTRRWTKAYLFVLIGSLVVLYLSIPRLLFLSPSFMIFGDGEDGAGNSKTSTISGNALLSRTDRRTDGASSKSSFITIPSSRTSEDLTRYVSVKVI